MAFWIPLEKYQAEHSSLYRALFHALRDSIRSGVIAPGTRLPSSRELSREYALSRGTATQVYEMLQADGYLETRRGRGTFVALRTISKPGPIKKAGNLKLSALARRLPQQAIRPAIPNLVYDLRVGRPAAEIFPARQWRSSQMQAIRRRNFNLPPVEVDATGLPDLKQAVATHLNQRRGLNVQGDDVEIVSGSMQALGILIQLLVDPGDPVVMENPGYHGIRNAVTTAGGLIIPAKVDEQGLQIKDWKARLAIVTPSHHFPTGSVLTLERRRELLSWARSHNAVIIEDDYDSEFKREGRPVEPLKVMDRDGRVVYTGTFSKTIHPSLRLGYVILPESIREPFRNLRSLSGSKAPAQLDQLTLGLFIKSGDYEKHLRRSARTYRERHDALIALFDKHLPDVFHWNPSNAGLHIFGYWRSKEIDYPSFTQACRGQGIFWTQPDPFFMGPFPHCALFGYTHINESQSEQILALMGKIYRSL